MLYTIALILHIMAGLTALVSGGLAISIRKGSRHHNLAGRLYTLAMVGVGLSAFVLCLLRYNPFLFVIGLFSTYMTLTGYRYLQFYRTTKHIQLGIDWALLMLTLCLSLGFFCYILLTERLQTTGLQPVLLVFMGILLTMLLSDAVVYRRLQQQTKAMLLRKHITRMGGAYISTITAFIVTNIHTTPVALGWLLPTIIGTPFIIYSVKKYTMSKKAAGRVNA